MAVVEYILALDGLPGIEGEINEYLEYINVHTKRYMGNTIHERVIRCRGCKRWGTFWLLSDQSGERDMDCIGRDPDGFCAWGELDGKHKR